MKGTEKFEYGNIKAVATDDGKAIVITLPKEGRLSDFSNSLQDLIYNYWRSDSSNNSGNDRTKVFFAVE